MSGSSNHFYDFGPFRLHLAECTLLRDGQPLTLTPKAFDLLLALVERGGHIVGKEELMGAVWPGTAVEESNLTHHISVLRKALGADERGRPFIETVPRRGYRFTAAVRDRKQESPLINSLAVLPFRPIVASHRDESLELGMADTLITKLSHLSRLTVRPLSAVRRFTDLGQDAIEAGRELAVDAVLEGSLQTAGDRVRVTIRLTHVGDGRTLWAEQFDERFTDIFTLEDAIAERVAGALPVAVLSEERSRLRRRYTESTEAYRLYLRGRYELYKYREESWHKAIACFKEAISEDPAYAMAHTGLSYCYLIASSWFLGPKESIAKAEAWARKALEIDDTLAEAHVSLAAITFSYHWDWARAEREIKRAIELKPKNAEAHWLYGGYLATVGRFDEGLAEMKQAQALDSLSLPINTDVGWVYYISRRYAEAREQLEKALELDPNYVEALVYLGRTYLAGKEYARAIITLKEACGLDETPWILAILGYAYAISGRGDEARRVIKQLTGMSKQKYVSPLHMAVIYSGLGEKGPALKWLEEGYEERADLLVNLGVDPVFDSLRSDERFADLLERIGLLASSPAT